MKRYLSFFRSTSTVSLVVLYLLTTFLFPFSAAAEGVVENVREFDPVVINSQSFEYHQQQISLHEEIQIQSSDIEKEYDDVEETVLETISSEYDVQEQDGDVSSEEDADTVVSSKSQALGVVCDELNTPTVSLTQTYIEAQAGGTGPLSLLSILTQIEPQAFSAQGDEISGITNTLADLFPFVPGFHTIEFSVEDSGCVSTAEVVLFVYGMDVSCPVEDVFVTFSYEGDWNVSTGSGMEVQEGQFIPLTYNDGQDFVPNEPSGVVDGFVRVLRTGSNFVIIRNGLEDETILDQILENIEFFNATQGDVHLYPDASGGGFLMIYFTPESNCDSGEEEPNPEPEPNPENPGGGTTTGSTQIGSQQTVVTIPQGEVLGVSTPACDFYITTFMAKHYQNKSEDVRRLQIFLNDYMAESLVVSGEYDNATYEAVKRFQTQESDEILAPWGITEATGIVKETTSRHINNIMCSELQIEIPVLFCVTTQTFLYPDGRVLTPDEHYNLVLGEYFENDGVSNIYTPVQSSNSIWEFEK